MTSGDYVLRGGVEGLERLKLLARVMRPATLALFDRVGVAPAMVCLDVGCGGGDVALDLARRVGPRGKVVGIDLDATKIDGARRRAADEGVANVEFRHSGAEDGFGAASYDLVCARFLLTHLKQPSSVIAKMVAALRPGGVLAVEDIDFEGHFCHPPSAAFFRYVELYTRVVELRGGDPNIGPKLPRLLAAAGITGVSMHVVQPAGIDGEVKLVNPVTLENVAASVVQEGLASEEEIRRLASELYAAARDSETVMSIARIVQAWGRKA